MLTFLFTVTSDGKCVGSEGGLDLGIAKVQHMTIFFDHVHFLYPLDTVHTQLFQRLLKKKNQSMSTNVPPLTYLEFLVICSTLMHNLLLSSCSALRGQTDHTLVPMDIGLLTHTRQQ